MSLAGSSLQLTQRASHVSCVWGLRKSCNTKSLDVSVQAINLNSDDVVSVQSQGVRGRC